jgi:hypothetical protein
VLRSRSIFSVVSGSGPFSPDPDPTSEKKPRLVLAPGSGSDLRLTKSPGVKNSSKSPVLNKYDHKLAENVYVKKSSVLLVYRY